MPTSRAERSLNFSRTLTSEFNSRAFRNLIPRMQQAAAAMHATGFNFAEWKDLRP
jgi:hypothetical protein